MITCPYCQNDNQKMLEEVSTGPVNPRRPNIKVYLCHQCSRTFKTEDAPEQV